MLHSLHWLPTEQRIKYKLLCFNCSRSFLLRLPSTFQNFFTFTLPPDSSALLQTPRCSEYHPSKQSHVVSTLSLNRLQLSGTNSLFLSAILPLSALLNLPWKPLFKNLFFSLIALIALTCNWCVEPVLNWANVRSPEHTSDTSTNYDSFLNWTFSSPNMVQTVQTLLHSQLACNEMQASARTCSRQHDQKCRLNSSQYTLIIPQAHRVIQLTTISFWVSKTRLCLPQVNK